MNDKYASFACMVKETQMISYMSTQYMHEHEQQPQQKKKESCSTQFPKLMMNYACWIYTRSSFLFTLLPAHIFHSLGPSFRFAATPTAQRWYNNKTNNGNPLYSGHDYLCFFYFIIVVTRDAERKKLSSSLSPFPLLSHPCHTFIL